LTNLGEYQNATNPLDNDTDDDDGFLDGDEVEYGTDPLDPTDFPVTTTTTPITTSTTVGGGRCYWIIDCCSELWCFGGCCCYSGLV